MMVENFVAVEYSNEQDSELWQARNPDSIR